MGVTDGEGELTLEV